MTFLPKPLPKLTLVGAGPGDVELITIKGMRAIQKADAILYDALACAELLEYAKPTAVKIFVGKRAGQHSLKQAEINELIVASAQKYGHVVRLKGGDPFVFGRGMEEMLYAEENGIPTEVIPGVSSALSVPVLQRIPLTHRTAADSFWVLTGTKTDGSFSKDLHLAAQSEATIVVLMGMNNLHEIINVFSAAGKANLPVGIIQNGSLPNEKTVFGTINTILAEVTQAKIGAPAIIVIGEVVNVYGNNVKKWSDLIIADELTN
jgi:uroporphyrin-III C-methyltransferase